eukprot:CAMPEP_0203666676 /NCGR_PEP_ID=MMETSP0090-20130426/3677_1 /ASSEMBLY_ACC=CAM_ASM_001088 /TAXON_ID=426623 /ORGANISM="Chaetoceros affinis, Strain CCMP159" /LENGTH=580 /DNA_ID=CAMNT_0050530633 /DNA_START=178 /DNA_END=1920 /DNA_ORIENTATION=+
MKRACEDVTTATAATSTTTTTTTTASSNSNDTSTRTTNTNPIASETTTTNSENKNDRHDIPRTVSQEHIILNNEGPKSKKAKVSTTAKATTTTTTTTVLSSTVSSSLSSPFEGKNYTNLVSESTSCILFATDEWFARAENLIKDSQPVFDPDLYCAEGKVMDGWESRRRRTEGHDWCVIANENQTLGKINDVVGIEVDTAYFTGNQTPRISIEVTNCCPKTLSSLSSSSSLTSPNEVEVEEEEWMYMWMPGAVKRLAKGGGVQGTGQSPTQIQKANDACKKFEWKEILPITELKPGYEETRMHYFMLDDKTRELARGFTHVRVNYFPDGGVARLRLWGHSLSPSSDANTISSSSSSSSCSDEEEIVSAVPSSLPYHHPELSLSTNGGAGLECSNKHYGVPANLIRPTYGKDMSDGWETARHPDRPPVLIRDPITNLIDNPLMDWAVLKLGMGGAVQSEGVSRIIIDTKHFKGNFPESVMVEGCDANANATPVSDEEVCAAAPDKEQGKVEWYPLLKRTTMGPDREHVFEKVRGELMNSDRAVTHVRVRIFPDGGISRVRIYGQPAETQKDAEDIDAAHLI